MAERLFEGKKVYYSGSIQGVAEIEPDFAWNLVRYMINNGAVVLSEHVAGRNRNERDEIRARNVGMTVEEMLKEPEPWFGIRKQDLNWVDEATHMVALVNAPSHGVGMELEHAILKPRLGLNLTPILCLVHEGAAEKLSYMIRGVTTDESPCVYIRTYNDLKSAQLLVEKLLTEKM